MNSKFKIILLWSKIILRGISIAMILMILLIYYYLKFIFKRSFWKLKFRLELKGMPSDLKKDLQKRYSDMLKNAFPSPLSLLKLKTRNKSWRKVRKSDS